MKTWRVEIRCDLVRGTWVEEYAAYPTHEVYYILAMSGKEAFIHFKHFLNDREAAENLLKRIKAVENFVPEEREQHVKFDQAVVLVKVWTRISDTKQYTWSKPLDWRRLLFRKLDEAQWRKDHA